MHSRSLATTQRWALGWICGLLLNAQTLQASGEPLWNLAWITDTQTPACECIAALVTRVGADKPRLVIHSGDTRFEWANRCAWESVLKLLRREEPPIEFHLAPGNHDLTHGVLKAHLRRAASQGVYRLDTGRIATGLGYYHNRVPEDVTGPQWPRWNPEIVNHPAWQPHANKRPQHHQHPEVPYRYIFRRGGIRFIVCDCYFTEEQRQWVRDTISQPDPSSATILIQHKHEVDDLARYFEGLEGRHNVKLALTGDHHHYVHETRHGVTFITAAGMASGPGGQNDALTLWVHENRLRLDRYVLPKEWPLKPIQGPFTIWSCKGSFTEYQKPPAPIRVLGPNLIYNGDFDNHIWYERYRGWSPSGWYQWFTRGGHAPEHAVGRSPSKPFPAHSGKEFVRIHMWAHAWRGGILQVVRGIQPCHYYRLTARGCFHPVGAPQPNARVGIDPCGGLADQFSVDVTKHPAPKYDEGIGDDPKTPQVDGPDLPDTTVWSKFHDHYHWGEFEAVTEARSDTATVILYCAPKQRPADQPIYEMNWDSVALVEVPWPTKRLVEGNDTLAPNERVVDVVITHQPKEKTAQVTWGTKLAAGASQVLYRFLDSHAEKTPVRSAVFPWATPVYYEHSAKRHWISIEDLTIPEAATTLEVLALSRICEKGKCQTIASQPVRLKLRGR